MTTFTEAHVEQAALAWLNESGWQATHGPDTSPEPTWRGSLD